jgi:hypothetical protein
VGEALSERLPWVSGIVALYAAGWVADVIGILAGLVDQPGSRDYCAGLYIASLPQLEALDWALRCWPESAQYLDEGLNKNSLIRARSDVRERCILATYGDGLSAKSLNRPEAREMFKSLWDAWDGKKHPNKSWPAQFVAAFELSRIRGIAPQFAIWGAWEQLYGWMRTGISVGGPPLDVDSPEYEFYRRGDMIRRLIASNHRTNSQTPSA